MSCEDPGLLGHARVLVNRMSRKRSSAALLRAFLARIGLLGAHQTLFQSDKRRQPPGKVAAEETQRVGSGSPRGAASRLMEAGQVLNSPPRARNGIPEPDTHRSIRLKSSSVYSAVELNQDIGGLEVSMRQRTFVEVAEEPGQLLVDPQSRVRRVVGGQAGKHLANILRQRHDAFLLDVAR